MSETTDLLSQFKESRSTKPDNKTKEMSAKKAFTVDPTKVYEFETLIKTEIARHQPISLESEVFDGESMRTIRYVPMAQSIFKDEQGDRFNSYSLPHVEFYRNTLSVDGKDARLVEYLLAYDAYDGNKHRLSRFDPLYTLVNKELLEDKKSAQHDNEFKALEVVNNADISDLKPIARVIFNITDTSEKAIKNKLRDVAKSKPSQILDNITNPKLKRIYEIQKAIDEGSISLNPDKNNAVWADTGTQICELKEGSNIRKAAEELATFSFIKGVGEEFLKVLRLKDIKE